MILQALKELSTFWQIDKPLGPAKIHATLRLDEDGSLIEASVCQRTTQERLRNGKIKEKTEPWQEFLAPKVNRTNASAIKADFLWGRMDRLIGMERQDKTAIDSIDQNVRQTLELTAALHVRAAESVAVLRPVARFYQRLIADHSLRATLHELLEREVLRKTKIKTELNVMFATKGLLLERAEALDFWVRHSSPPPTRDDGSPELPDRCIVCGERCAAQKKHEGKIQGVPGCMSMGASLVTFDKASFMNYDLEDSLCAPTCARCVQAYTNAINTLLSQDRRIRGRGTRVRERDGGAVVEQSANAAFLFWTRTCTTAMDVLVDPAQPMTSEEDEEDNDRPQADATALRHLAEAVRKGETPTSLGPADDFHMLVLSGNQGRVAIVDTLETSVANLERNVVGHFAKQEIISQDPREKVFPLSLGRLREAAGKPVREAGRLVYRLPADLLVCYLKSALLGGKLPRGLMYAVLATLRSELHRTARERRGVPALSPYRVGLLRAIYNDNFPGGPIMGEKLDTDQRDVPYLCGRLLAVLSLLQNEAIGQPKASVVSRFFGAACARPATGLYVPLKLHVHHLMKLRGPSKTKYEFCIRNIVEKLRNADDELDQDFLPKALGAEQQVRFTIGFYHELAYFARRDFAEDKAQQEIDSRRAAP